MDENRFSSQGKLGAIKFWQRFNSDPVFREKMSSIWKKQRVNHDQKMKAAKIGAAALWHKYHTDPAFKNLLDQKLKMSRSRGGTMSLFNLDEKPSNRSSRIGPNFSTDLPTTTRTAIYSGADSSFEWQGLFSVAAYHTG